MIANNPYGMPTADTVRTNEGLLHFVWERENVRLSRLAGKSREEWTNDPVLQKYKFTNIHREHDRVSQWLNDKVMRPCAGRHDLWFIMLICRLINWPPTLQRMIDDGVLFRDAADFNIQDFSDSIERFREDAGKVYSGAYMVYPTKMDPGGVKSLALGKHIIAPVLNRKDEIEHELYRTDREVSIELFVNQMSRCFGISTFMAGQVAADLTYVNGPLCEACDLYDYAPMGPGSQRGLNYLHGRTAYANWKQPEFNKALKIIFNLVIKELGICTLTLHDVQNIMCEFSKYCKAVLGEGKPKSTYQPETEF